MLPITTAHDKLGQHIRQAMGVHDQPNTVCTACVYVVYNCRTCVCAAVAAGRLRSCSNAIPRWHIAAECATAGRMKHSMTP